MSKDLKVSFLVVVVARSLSSKYEILLCIFAQATHSLFVGNIPKNISVYELRDIFQRFGDVVVSPFHPLLFTLTCAVYTCTNVCMYYSYTVCM